MKRTAEIRALAPEPDQTMEQDPMAESLGFVHPGPFLDSMKKKGGLSPEARARATNIISLQDALRDKVSIAEGEAIDKHHTALQAEVDAIGKQAQELEASTKKVDRKSQKSVDAHNAKVKAFNERVEGLKKNTDAFNERVSAYRPKADVPLSAIEAGYD
jgi:hypothetical protein